MSMVCVNGNATFTTRLRSHPCAGHSLSMTKEMASLFRGKSGDIRYDQALHRRPSLIVPNDDDSHRTRRIAMYRREHLSPCAPRSFTATTSSVCRFSSFSLRRPRLVKFGARSKVFPVTRDTGNPRGYSPSCFTRPHTVLSPASVAIASVSAS